MKRIVIVFIGLLYSFNVLANSHNIVATVNGLPITDYDLKERKNIVRIVNNVDVVSQSDNIALTSAALDSLVEEQLLFQYANRIKKMPTDEQVKSALASIEKNNGLPIGGLNEVIREKGGSIESLRNKIRADIIKMSIMSQLAEGLNITSKEIEVAVLNGIKKDAQIDAIIFTSYNKDIDTYKEMLKLQKKLKSCCEIEEKQYEHIASLQKINCRLSALDTTFKIIIQDLAVNKASKVFEACDGFKIVLLCNKTIDNISNKENELVVDFLTNKKVTQKASKIFSDLKRTAVIEKFNKIIGMECDD